MDPCFHLSWINTLGWKSGSDGNLMFEISETVKRLSTAAAPFYNPNSVGGLLFPHLLATLVIICLFAQSPWKNYRCPRFLWVSASFLAPSQEAYRVGWAQRRQPSWGPGRLGSWTRCTLVPEASSDCYGTAMLSLPSGAPSRESTQPLGLPLLAEYRGLEGEAGEEPPSSSALNLPSGFLPPSRLDRGYNWILLLLPNSSDLRDLAVTGTRTIFFCLWGLWGGTPRDGPFKLCSW